jgi:hypothetical protein
MTRHNHTTQSTCLCLALTACALGPATLPAQVGGIRIDAQGLLQQARILDSVPATPQPVARRHGTRTISLKRLERTIAEHIDAGRPIPPDVRFLAGLQRVDDVVLLPDRSDVLMIGPAAGWIRLPTGEVVDPLSHRPVLELDDLAHALRFAANQSPTESFIGCSIDPTTNGIKNYKRYLKSLSGAINPNRVPKLVSDMQAAMGHQDVRIFGIPANSRFACKLVAADYRLKRVAMGFDRPPVRGLLNYMDLLARSGKQAVKRQHRFWFVATHEGISRSPDGQSWHLSGSGLEVRTAAAGTPQDPSASNFKPKAASSARRMAANLTRYFPQLVKHIPVFGELENLIRLTVAAEIAVNAPLADSTTRWSSQVLVDPIRYRTQTTLAPRRVPSLAAVRKAQGRNWILSVSGGIALQPPPVQLRSFGTLDQQLAERIRRIQAKPHPTKTSWWWD